MAATPDPRPATSGLERVRREILNALHYGRLAPGDRAPSVRRLADRTGMNRKTVHRAYTRLAREGLLDLRPGSGTYIAESAPLNELVAAAHRCRSTARALGLDPGVFSAFLDTYLNDGLRDLPLAVVESSQDHVGTLAAALQGELGIDPRPSLLARLVRDPAATVAGCRGLVTTAGHRDEARRVRAGVPVFAVALDPALPALLLERARQGPVLMVVRDRGFGAVFRSDLARMGIAPELLQRFTFRQPEAAHALLRRATRPVTVHVSPLLPLRWAQRLPARARVVRSRWRLEPASRERLRAALALERATRRDSATG